MPYERSGTSFLPFSNSKPAFSKATFFMLSVMLSDTEALADCQKLGDLTVVARTLLVQINCTANVATNMSPHTYTTVVASSDLPGARDKTPQRSSGLRTVYMYLPQPIASCLRSPPEDTKPSTLSSAAFPAAVPCPLH